MPSTKGVEYFSLTYEECRKKFLEAAEAAGAERIEHHLICQADGVDYFMDTAFFPGKIEGRLLVHSSGTHGVEGYTGSAIQTKLLREWSKGVGYQDGPSILFVHAINPYGMAWYRRFNEQNVDLNRNYLTVEQWKMVKARDPNAGGYETFRHLLSPPRAPTCCDSCMFKLRVYGAVVRNGFTAIKRAFVTGQYHHPEGIYYGGDGEQPSVATLRKVLRSYSGNGKLKQAVFIDVHSGLGPEGVDTMMTSNSFDAERAAKVFPKTRIQNDAASKSGPSEGYNLALGIIRPREELAGIETIAVAQEFGTVKPLEVGKAIILENAAYHYCRGSKAHEKYRIAVRDAFYPQKLSYKTSVLEKGDKAFKNAISYLTTNNDPPTQSEEPVHENLPGSTSS